MSDDDSRIEAQLLRYRPVGPPAGLRDRALRPVSPAGSRRRAVWWLSVAAMLAISLGLHLATDRVSRQTAAILGAGQVRWTAEAEEMARMMDGDGWGREYVALALAADRNRLEPTARGLGPTNIPGESQWPIR